MKRLSENVDLIPGSAPEITPWSYPNRPPAKMTTTITTVSQKVRPSADGDRLFGCPYPVRDGTVGAESRDEPPDCEVIVIPSVRIFLLTHRGSLGSIPSDICSNTIIRTYRSRRLCVARVVPKT